jgi:hypothetical protein
MNELISRGGAEARSETPTRDEENQLAEHQIAAAAEHIKHACQLLLHAKTTTHSDSLKSSIYRAAIRMDAIIAILRDGLNGAGGRTSI